MSNLPWYVKGFIALGGLTLVTGAVIKGAEPAGKAAMGLLLRWQWFHSVVAAHKDKIKQIIENFEKGVEEGIDEA